MIKKIINCLMHPSKILFYFASRNIIKMDDESYLKLSYKVLMGKKLDLNNPKKFSEKLQWLKLNDRQDIYTTMVDKYGVKEYVARKIGDEYIIPTLEVYSSFDEIDFSKLPESFVLKCTHDSGGNIVCRDKSKLDFLKSKKKIESTMKKNFYYAAREWPYKNVKPRIIVEQFMKDENQKNGLIDYKFYCFHGKPQFLYVSEGLENHSTAKISFLNLDYSFADFQRLDYQHFRNLPVKPVNYNKMIEIATELSQNIPFVRVDLYEINNKVYFSELTFSPCGGFMKFEPEKYDEKIGEMIDLNQVGGKIS